MAGKLVVATGISGCGRKEYLENWQHLCREKEKKTKVYHVGQMLFDQAKKAKVYITPENVLNTNPYVLAALRSGVFETIFASLEKDLEEYDAVVLSIHSFFYWKKVFSRAYDHFYLGKFNPDMFICFIDNSKYILEKLVNREQWRSQDLTEQEILYWQNIEVETTGSLAELKEKKFFVLSVGQPTETLYNLVFEPDIEPVYVNIPITHLAEKKDQDKAKAFIKKLGEYFVVFNPLTIETGAVDLRHEEDKTIHQQTVNRDLYWLLRQSKKNIAYFPKIVFSPGVINEVREAYETNKEAWIIYPAAESSPFLDYFSTRIFRSEKEFFEFLDEYKASKKKQ